MDEMKTCILRLIVLSSLLSGTDTTNETIIVQPSLTVTLINDPAFFNCSTRPTSQEVEWLFGSEQYSQSFIYSYGKVNEIYKDRFQVENYTYNNRKWFNLKLRSTAKGDAGRYTCRDPVNDEERKVHLTVLETEPACDSNLNSGGLIIGCGTKPETVQLSCSVRYNGEKIPELQWIKTGENIVINSSLLECSDSGSIYTCNLTMESELQMEGDSYVCQTTQSMTRQYKCTSGVFRIIYVLGEHTELIGIVNDKVYYCSVNSSSQSCTSSWIFGNGTTNWTESHDHVIEFKRPGRFICQTICVFGNNNCTFTTMTVNLTVRAEPQDDDKPILNIGQIAGIVVGAVVVTAICVIAFIMWFRRNKKRKQAQNASNRQETREREVLLRAENARESSNPSQRQPQGPPQRETLNGHDPPAIESVSLDVLYNRASESSNEQDEPERDAMSQDAEQAGGENILRDIKSKTDGKRDKRIRGLTILNDELFVAFEISNIIEIFPIDSRASNRSSTVKDLMDPGAIASCATNNCLYIMDQRRNSPRRKIFRVKPDGEEITIWETDDGERGRISVNRDGNVVMTVYDKHKLKIYSPDGILAKTIDLSGTSIDFIYHAINLADEIFILCHGMCTTEVESKLHRVCKVDATGNVSRSFGKEKGSDNGHLSSPAYLAKRNDGSILVADQGNHRIIQLSSDLKFMKEIFPEETDKVSRPEAIYVYEKTETSLLFVGCNETSNSGGYVLVLPLSR